MITSEDKVKELACLKEQMLKLRNDSSLIFGITLNTLAGDIHIAKKEIAVSLLDSMIKYLKDEIRYCER